MSSKVVARFRDIAAHDGCIFGVDAFDCRVYLRPLPDGPSTRCQGFDATMVAADTEWTVVSTQSIVAISVYGGIVYGVGDNGKIYSQTLASMTQDSQWIQFCGRGYAEAVAVGRAGYDAVLNDVIYVVGKDNIVYSQPLTLEGRWEKMPVAKKMIALAVHQGRLFGAGINQGIYVLDSTLARDGQTLEWKSLGKGWASALAVDEKSNMLYVLGHDHAIYRKAVADVESMQSARWQCVLQANEFNPTPVRANEFDPTPVWTRICSNYCITDETPRQSSEATDPSWRLMCVSDTHGQHHKFDMEVLRRLSGNVLIHAGDLTHRGRKEELETIIRFFRELVVNNVVQHVVAIAGNHDGILQQSPDSETAAELLSVCNYLEDQRAIVSDIEFYGSPWQPEFERHEDYCKAFTLRRGENIKAKWDPIPHETDVLVVHGPPLGCRDLSRLHRRAGCKDLLDAIVRLRPRVVVFGHIHECHGCSRLNGDCGTLLVNAASLQRGGGLHSPIVVELPKDRTLPAQWVQTESITENKPSGFGLT